MFDELTLLIAAKPSSAWRDHERCAVAYATCLLPTIFPGTRWKETSKWYSLLYENYGRIGGREAPGVHQLLDHRLAFRRVGTKGPGTWDNTVILGQPYRQPEDGDDLVNWLSKRSVRVWTRPDLSAWYPGSTCLVLAARGLENSKAQEFGFRVVEQSAKVIPLVCVTRRLRTKTESPMISTKVFEAGDAKGPRVTRTPI